MSNNTNMTDREAIIDTVTKYVIALDDGDAELLSSSITEDMTMDLTNLNKAGFAFRPFVGREVVVASLMGVVGTGLDTTHHISNHRIALLGDSAELSCYALAQHFRKGEGPSPTYQDYFLMGNRYKATLIRQGLDWRIGSLSVTVSWTQGDFGVMKTR